MSKSRTPRLISGFDSDGNEALYPTRNLQFKSHHGKTAAGIQVNSLSTAPVGTQHTVIRDSRGQTLKVTNDELEVMVAQLATKAA